MRDRWLMVLLLALFALAAALHVKELGRTGLALPPVFAVQLPGGDAYPVVGGLRLERSSTLDGLEVGDRLLQVGDASLEGVPYAGFDAVVLAEADGKPTVPIVYERGGERFERDLAMQRYAHPWARLPFMAALVLVATIVLLRSPGTRQGRLFFAGLTLIAVGELPFYGGPRLQSLAYVALFNTALPLGIWLWLRWLVGFPDGVPDEKRLSRHIAWIVLVFPLARVSYHLGGPIPTAMVPDFVLLSDALLAATSVGIVTWNYAHSDPVGRRQVKWVVFGGYVGCLPLLAVALLNFTAGGSPEGAAFHDLFAIVMIAPLAVVLGLLIGIVRSNLFDIDRLVSVTAAYSISIGAVLGVVLAAVPTAAAALSAATALDEGTLRFAITLVLGVAAVPLYTRLRAPIQRFLFPRREHLARGVRQLSDDIDDCDTHDGVSRLVADRLEGLFEPGYVSTLKLSADGIVTVSGPTVRGVTPSSPLMRWIASHAWPAIIERGRFDDVVVEPPPGSTLRMLAPPAAVVPLRDGKDLAALVLLGPPISGDIYTPSDVTLLGQIAERASSQLRALRDREALASQRARGDELEVLKEAAEHAHEVRSRFLAAASHDLRQPLHALSLFIDALAESGDGGAGDPVLIQRIQRSMTSLQEMFDSLLDISRLDVGAVVVSPARFDLGALMADVGEQLEPAARRKGLTFLVEAPACTVESDPVLLGRIVRNLGLNAVRYTDHGTVGLRVATTGSGFVTIEIHDTGRGVPASRQREIFDEFTQLDAGAGEGLGLGLSIVARLAKLLGHDVSVESTPGLGSVFSVRVPLVDSEARPAIDEAPPAAVGIDLSGRRVLVVDDDLQILEAMARVMRRWGCDVALAATLDDVEQSLSGGGRPEVVVADWRLQNGETGVQAIELVRKHVGEEVPAALVSGDSVSSPPEGLRVIRKPVPAFRLRALVTELLGEATTRND